MERSLSVEIQIILALRGKNQTQKWLAAQANIKELKLSRKLTGKVPFKQEEVDRINVVLADNITLEAKPFVYKSELGKFV